MNLVKLKQRENKEIFSYFTVNTSIHHKTKWEGNRSSKLLRNFRINTISVQIIFVGR